LAVIRIAPGTWNRLTERTPEEIILPFVDLGLGEEMKNDTNYCYYLSFVSYSYARCGERGVCGSQATI
jgi:hypothetical protein